MSIEPQARPETGKPTEANHQWPLGGWIFSADDHILEYECDFQSRVPQRLRDGVPRIVDHEGGDAWLFEGVAMPITTADGSASWTKEERPKLEQRNRGMDISAGGSTMAQGRTGLSLSQEERVEQNIVRVEEDFRPSVYNADARVADMDRDGVWTSVLIPSMSFGFAGQRYSLLSDHEAGLAAAKAYNDWLYEAFSNSHPGRFVCSQVPWLVDPEVGAEEVRRNAGRGFTAILFPENPERFGFPSIHTRHWDRLWRACEETETVLNIHLGTGLSAVQVSSDSPRPVLKATLAANPILSVFDWVFSGIMQRFPKLKAALTEGGIDWVPLVYGRLETFGVDVIPETWPGDLSPAELLLDRFWFAALFDVGAYAFLDEHCPTHVMIETDFPHGDTFWPASQQHFAGRLDGLDAAARQRMRADNAAALYRHQGVPTSG